MGKNYLVSRHCGAINWMRQALGVADAVELTHLESPRFGAGDRVFGVVPLDHAASICAQGATLHALVVDVPQALRGQELKADDLSRLGARLVRFEVRALDADRAQGTD